MKKYYSISHLWVIIIFLLIGANTHAQLLINEICPSNISVIQNSNGQYDDWIELYNSSGASLNLSGYGLSDDPTQLYNFKFPSYTLGTGGRVLVFANSKNNSVLVNHWEMAVDAHGTWRYAPGSASLDTNWRNLSRSEEHTSELQSL